MKIQLFFLSFLVMLGCQEETRIHSDKKSLDFETIKFSHDIFNLQKEVKLRVENKNENVPIKIKSKSSFFEVKTKKKTTFLSKKIFNLYSIKDSSNFKNLASLNITQSVLSKEGFIGLKSKFVNVNSNGTSHEMYFQEGFDKRIIESNKNREGILFTYDKTVEIQYNPTKTEDQELSNDLNKKINSWLNNTTETECIIDVRKAGKFLAICDAFNISSLSNISFAYYLNPVSNLIEPFVYYNLGQNQDSFKKALKTDPLITQFTSINANEFANIKEQTKHHKLTKFSTLKEKIDFTSLKSDSSLKSCHSDELFKNLFELKGGKYSLKEEQLVLNKPLIIPPGLKVSFLPGTQIDILKGGFILSFSEVEMNGTKDNQINIQSSDTLGSGFHVINALSTSNLQYVNFKGLSNLNYTTWKLPSAVTFYESPVNINYCTFDNNNCEDALNIFRSTPYTFMNSIISNTFSDAFDADFSDGKIIGSKFINSGNDGVDISGSTILIENTTFENISDKALSAGEKSNMTVNGIKINGASLAVTSKDLSKVDIKNTEITNSEVIYSAFQKKSEFGPSSIVAQNVTYKNFKEENLIEEGSKLKVNGEKIHNYRDDVKKYLYGNEYGKETVK